MERAFAEKMKLEGQNVGMYETDTRSALEAIKKRFYDDLHYWMKIFSPSVTRESRKKTPAAYEEGRRGWKIVGI